MLDSLDSASPQDERPDSRTAFSQALGSLDDERSTLAVWRRVLPPGLGKHLEAWAASHPVRFEGVVGVPGDDLSTAMQGIEEPHRTWLQEDFAVLLNHFARFTGDGRLKVVFESVRDDQCRKLHVDYVRYRLVTTYAGPGTEWVPEEAVRRDCLGIRLATVADSNQAIVPDFNAVRRALPGDVIVMKGACHPSGRGAVHRSPPIDGTGQTRIVLVASTVEE